MFTSLLSSCSDPQAAKIFFLIAKAKSYLHSLYVIVLLLFFLFFVWFAGLLVRLVAEELKEHYEET